MLGSYGHIGLFLAVAILFAVTTMLLPFFLSFPSRVRARLSGRTYLFFSDIVPLLMSSFVRFITFGLDKSGRLVPWNPNPVKESTYECGMETVGKAWVQFNFRYYFYALLFIALDVLVVFLYPWAVELRQLGLFAFIAILIFVLIIMVGYVYAWRKGVLEWK